MMAKAATHNGIAKLLNVESLTLATPREAETKFFGVAAMCKAEALARQRQ